MKDGTWFDGWNDMGRETGDYWNPLTDDGDALRLAVKLRLSIGFPRPDVVWLLGRKGEVTREVVFNDPYAATRRAIVRAAAEIGSKT
jgi:hypothetical protein